MSANEQRIEALRAALGVAPDDSTLRALLAESLEAEGLWDDAVAERRLLASALADDPGAKLALARAYVGAGKSGPAEVILDELAKAGSMPPEGWRLKARILGDDRSPQTEFEDPSPSPTSATPPKEPGLVGQGPDPVDAPPPPNSRDSNSGSGPSTERDDMLERPTTRFTDVGGMEGLKEAIRLKIIYPVANAEMYKAYGQKAGGGLLLYGPPGCGKTHLARATAGELGATFIVVGIADVLEMWIGSSERNLAGIFATARLHTPCVLFFDEIDALAAKRSDFNSASGRQLINQFLSELDGLGGTNEDILVLGATNAPWHVDPAFRRPGRFDEVLFVPPPDPEARREIFRILLRDRPVGKIDLSRLVSATDSFSGADIKGIVDRAAQRKLAVSLRDGKVRPLETDDLTAAAREFPPTTREWFATVKNYVMYANQSGLYDAVRPYIR